MKLQKDEKVNIQCEHFILTVSYSGDINIKNKSHEDIYEHIYEPTPPIPIYNSKKQSKLKSQCIYAGIPRNSKRFVGIAINDNTGYPFHRCDYCDRYEIATMNKEILDESDNWKYF